MRRQLPDDLTERYNVTSVLIKTFVETSRFTSALYKVPTWMRSGATQGRGRYKTHMKGARPGKDIWLPFRRGWRRPEVILFACVNA